MKITGPNILRELQAKGVEAQWSDGVVYLAEDTPRNRAILADVVQAHVPDPDDPLLPVVLIVNRLENRGLLRQFAHSLTPEDVLLLAARGRETASRLRGLLDTAGIEKAVSDEILRSD